MPLVSHPSRLLLLLLVGLLMAGGCVRRRLTVRSNPPGAVVYIDNQLVGKTPCSLNYIYYGTREIRLVKDGYETLTVNQPIPTPWYEVPPLDFFSEVVNPNEIRDERTVSFNLQPQLLVPHESLVARGEQLRQGVRSGGPIPVTGRNPSPVGEPFARRSDAATWGGTCRRRTSAATVHASARREFPPGGAPIFAPPR